MAVCTVGSGDGLRERDFTISHCDCPSRGTIPDDGNNVPLVNRCVSAIDTDGKKYHVQIDLANASTEVGGGDYFTYLASGAFRAGNGFITA